MAVHLGPVSGIVFRSIGVPLATAQHLMLYGTVRGVLSAATRLGIVGSYEAQRLQRERNGWLESLSSACTGLGTEDLAQVAPVVDLFQSTHDRLYSRLFQS